MNAAGAPHRLTPRRGAAAPRGLLILSVALALGAPTAALAALDSEAAQTDESGASPGRSAESSSTESSASPGDAGASSAATSNTGRDGVDPPLPEPRPDEQSPAPYRSPPEPPLRPWLALVSVDLELALRGAEASAVRYGPGFSYGVSARMEPWYYLALRMGASHSAHSVELDPSYAELDGARLEQPGVGVTTLFAQLQPTWPITDRLRVYAGVGLGWSRAKFEAPTLSDGRTLATRERTSVSLEWSGSLGGWWEVIPRWLLLGASLTYAAPSSQSGDAYGSRQAFSEDGRLLHLPAMSPFANRIGAGLHLGVAP